MALWSVGECRRFAWHSSTLVGLADSAINPGSQRFPDRRPSLESGDSPHKNRPSAVPSQLGVGRNVDCLATRRLLRVSNGSR
jgi:hypothetical protein